MNQEQAFQLWDDLYGDVDTAYDYASHLMRKSDFDNENSIVGWTVDYKKPLAQGGSMLEQNLIPCSFSTYRIREEKNAFTIGSHSFEVRKGKAYKTYELFDITDKSNPLCLDPYEMDQDPEYNRARKKAISSYGTSLKNPTFNINDVYKKALKTALDDIDYREEGEEEIPASESLNEENTMNEVSPSPSLNQMVEEEKEESLPSETQAPDRTEAEPEEEKEFVPELKEMEEENEVILPETTPEEEVLDSERKEEPVPAKEEENEPSDSDEVRELKLLIQKKDEEIVALNDRLSELDDIIAQKERDGSLTPDYERVDATEEPEEAEIHDESDLLRIQELEEELLKTQDELKKTNEDKISLESDKADALAKVSLLNESLKEMDDVKVQNAEKDGEILGLRSQLNTLLQENESLKKEKEDDKAKAVEESDRGNALLKEKEELQSRLDALEAEKQTSSGEKETEIQQLKDKNDSLEKELTSLKEEKEDLERQNQAAKEEKENLVAQMEQKSAFVLSLENENENLKKEKDQAVEDHSLIQSEKEASEQDRNRLQEENQALQETISALEEEKNRFVSSSADTDKKVTDLTEELDSLKKEKEDLHTEKENLVITLQEKENRIAELETGKNQLLEEMNHQKEEKDKEISLLTVLKDTLTSKTEELQSLLDSEKEKFDNQSEELTRLRQKNEENEAMMASLQEKLAQSEEQSSATVSEKDDRIKALEEQLESMKKEEDELLTEKQAAIMEKDSVSEEKKALEEQLKDKTGELESQYNEYQKYVLASNEQIEELNAEINTKEKEILVLNSGGSPKYLKEILDEMKKEPDFTSENIRNVLNHNPSWKVKDDQEVSFVPDPVSSEEEPCASLEAKVVSATEEDLSYLRKKKEKEQKALSYFDENYGVDVLTVSDFAGRFIRKDDYGNADSSYGWDYALLDDQEADIKTNVIIMNLKTLKDYRSNGTFDTNSHSYEVKEVNGVKKVVSNDYITDPFDYHSAVSVTLANEKKTTPLIYIMVKGLSTTGNDPDSNNLMTFFDLIDRTVRRCCPDSFMEMKTSLGAKSDYAFITFDGMVEGAYKETIDYALVLNSYRQEFNKSGKLNAIIVIGEVNVPFSMRHFSFEKLYGETKNTELLALRYEFMATSVVDSMIKKTIHIGPSIIDKLPINQNITKESRIGKGNFAKAYEFKGEFRTYNYGYTLRSDSSENTDKQ